jgi:transcriptional regulator GlxA family with amidase domain
LSAQFADRPPLREVQHWIAEHPGAGLSVETLAERASLSPRQVVRALGVSPAEYRRRSARKPPQNRSGQPR